jgi:SAM-dependent methyltransferase
MCWISPPAPVTRRSTSPVACGTNGRVVATDISEAFLALARQNLRTTGWRHVDTRLADAQALGLAGAGFDAAVCRLGLMFCREPRAALGEARAALRPGGRFSAVVFSHPRNNPCVAISMAVARKHAGLPAPAPDATTEPGTLFSLGEPGLLARLLQDAGFADIEVRPILRPASPALRRTLCRLRAHRRRACHRDPCPAAGAGAARCLEGARGAAEGIRYRRGLGGAE